MVLNYIRQPIRAKNKANFTAVRLYVKFNIMHRAFDGPILDKRVPFHRGIAECALQPHTSRVAIHAETSMNKWDGFNI